jgi:hypothetical protein
MCHMIAETKDCAWKKERRQIHRLKRIDVSRSSILEDIQTTTMGLRVINAGKSRLCVAAETHRRGVAHIKIMHI